MKLKTRTFIKSRVIKSRVMLLTIAMDILNQIL